MMAEQETLDDRISELPDELLVQILSLLPTKDAVASCLLSKRWPSLWNSVHNFHFVSETFKNEQNFISFVDHVLTHSTCSKINKFQVDFHRNDWDVDSKISEWLNFTVEKKAEDVGLHSDPFGVDLSYELSLSMCTCSSFITLCLSYWVIDKGMVIAWNSLKNLTLRSVELDNDDFVKLLSSCPALETMELSFCEGFRRLEITSSNLKRLTLREPLQLLEEGHDTFLEIFAPYLQHLDISGNLGFIKCSLVVFMMKLEGVMLPELRCKCLTLKLYLWKYNLYGIASLLQASPLLESLNIHIKAEFSDSPCEIEQSYFAEVDKVSLPSWIPNTVFPNLKCVKIVSCVTQCLKKWSTGGSCKLFELSKFLLKNAVALQKLVIVAKRTKCCTCSESCVSQHLSLLAEKLLDSPRSSTNFVMIYQEIA